MVRLGKVVGKMFWYSSRGCWYCKISGQKQRLSPDEADARELYAQHVTEHGRVTIPTVHALVTLYLDSLELEPATIAKKRRILDTLVDHYDAMEAADFEPRHVSEWMTKVYPNVGPTSKRDRISEIKTVWRYGMQNGIITKTRIGAIKKPAPGQREHYIPRDQWETYLAGCKNTALRELFQFMLWTGARAQEVVVLRAEWWTGDRFVVPKGKAKGKRRARMILVPKAIRERVEEKVQAGGVVFRNTRGLAWTKDSLNCSFRRLKKTLNDPGLCATSARHSFAVAKIESGVSIELVAQLMGHTSTRMVYQRYGHYLKTNVLTAAAEAGF